MPLLQVTAGRPHIPAAYRATATRTNDLVSTRLDIRFDFHKRYLYGQEWVTLTPHFYPTDSLTLDAKGMLIRHLALVNGKRRRPLTYKYDGKTLRVHLGRTFRRNQQYTLYIDYVSRPDEYAANNPGGSAAITSDKGLYFINPDGENPYMPVEVWSQGETQSNSVWFPTIDRPDQKSMEEISMTVADSLTTLSNGKLISQKKHKDGTRTDTWKMEHPNSPYLFMIAAGPFVVVKDHWKNIPVDYYVEKKYAPYARQIFGHTPAMIGFYSGILGVPYQWSKYDQVVARDFISGAMENTTATLHGEFLYQTSRQLRDAGYRNESVIAHELFHHWFGDLVTCESWSNITVNESFADFSEMLWAEHEYGKDLADQHSYQAMQEYFDLAASGKDHPLVDFYYKNREDVFYEVTYQKGGRILNMLRHVVGDSAFFSSLHYYLEQHKFQPAEAQDLRLAFEHVTGRDLNWFWNEWYYGQGYPQLDIRYRYNESLHIVRVIVKQTQHAPVFELPFAIDIYSGGKKERHQVTMMQRSDTFTFHYKSKPDLINVDGDKMLLDTRNDHKSIANYLFQYRHAGLYLDRLEAVQACAKAQDTDKTALGLLLTALGDKFYGIRNLAIKSLDMEDAGVRKTATPVLTRLLKQDPRASVRSQSLTALAGSDPAAHRELISLGIRDSSLLVESTALGLLDQADPDAAYRQARLFERNAESPLSQVICQVLAERQDSADFPYIQKNVLEHGSFEKFGYLQPYLYMLGHVMTDNDTVDPALERVKAFAAEIGARYGAYVVSMMQNFAGAKQQAADRAMDAGLKVRLSGQAAYGRKLISEMQKSMGE
jgi:aminopeptidase N